MTTDDVQPAANGSTPTDTKSVDAEQAAKNAARNKKKNEKLKAKKLAAKQAAAGNDDDVDGLLDSLSVANTKSTKQQNGASQPTATNGHAAPTSASNSSIPTQDQQIPPHPLPIRIMPKPDQPSKINTNNAKLIGKQTSPPRIPVSQLYQNNIYPAGEITLQPQDFNTYRVTSEEKRAADKMHESEYNSIREAAEVHRQTRADFLKWVRPGLPMIEIAQYIENSTRSLLNAKWGDISRGWGFPTGVSLNHVAAHFTPNYTPKDKAMYLQEDDVMKVDFGTQINGRIVDCR